jgi:hypothetical protein
MPDPRPPAPPRLSASAYVPGGGLPQEAPPSPPPATAPGILPKDTLPPEAMRDPAFSAGPRTSLASAHPALALRYGIMRAGKRLVSAGSGLWAEPSAPAPAARLPLTDWRGAEAGTPSILEAAGTAKPTKEGEENPKLKALEEDDEEIDLPPPKEEFTPNEFDMARIRELMHGDLFNNNEQLAIIEARIPKRDPNDDVKAMLLGQLIREKVPVIPGVYEPVFQQNPWWVESKLQEMVVMEIGSLDVNKVHLMDKYSVWGMICSLVNLGGKELPALYTGTEQNLDMEKFAAKCQVISRLPTELIASLMVHWTHFGLRMRRLLLAVRGALKNG